MDSGNSTAGSMQSSSSGAPADEDSYDSHSRAQQQQPQPHHHHILNQLSTTTTTTTLHHTHAPIFDPLLSSSSTTSTTFLDPSSSSIQRSNPTIVNNLDMPWYITPRSGLDQPDLSTVMPQFAVPPPPPPPPLPPLLQQQQQQEARSNANSNSTVVRNPKKRSRASRRAPTTVLTTDTTNFRAMVQEFTGIPAQPFTSSSSSSPFPRTRLDLFVGGGSSSSAAAGPPYLLRPFAQKVPLPSSFPQTNYNSSPSSSMVMSNILFVPNSNNPINNSYQQLPSSSSSPLGLLKQHQHLNNVNMNNMQNNNNNNPASILSFQSILQAQQIRYPSPSPSPSTSPLVVASKDQETCLEIPHHHNQSNNSGTVDSHLRMGVLEEQLGFTRAHVSTTNNISNGGVLEKGRTEGMVESWINCSSD
ncbi:hypothetical protein S245_032788 [Arachis hypogaea]|uniref:VQ domain-containing protein n=1 Tax=Arachis hypogaea TaxID=3818 RepID=A0A445B8Z0_ARAHY|nr:mucin-3A-like [Arachis hypogaea]RYR35131.1 hypothetical protein Ahy_A10g050268 [Arachis hypogaea]